ncbi:hypothetical protein YC2023_033889 [Brassica napus]
MICSVLFCVFVGFGKTQDCGTKGRMDTNDSLRVASLWHSMHAISQQHRAFSKLTPLISIASRTKFFVVCEPGTPHMESLLRYVYELYTDYVLKNPFYEIEMPIRCELFDINLTQAVQSDRVALLGR